jgi:hypothetical protein
MSRRPVVFQDELFAVADRLVSEGRDVTALLLREELGGGSLTTIYKYLTLWQEARWVPPAQPGAEIPEAVLAGFVNAWRFSKQQAASEFDALKEKAKKEVTAAERQFQESLESVAKLEKEAEADSLVIEGLNNKVGSLQEQLQSLQMELAVSKAMAQQQAEELVRVREERDKERVAAEEERKAREVMIREAAQLQGEVALLQKQNAELLVKLDGESSANS